MPSLSSMINALPACCFTHTYIFFEICTVFYATLTIRFCSLNHSEKWNLKLNRARKNFPNGLVFRKKNFLNGFPFGKIFPNGFPFGKFFFPNSNPFGKIFLALLSSRFHFSEWFSEQNLKEKKHNIQHNSIGENSNFISIHVSEKIYYFKQPN